MSKEKAADEGKSKSDWTEFRLRSNLVILEPGSQRNDAVEMENSHLAQIEMEQGATIDQLKEGAQFILVLAVGYILIAFIVRRKLIPQNQAPRDGEHKARSF